MVDISVKNYTDAKVCTIKIGNKKLFWVKVNDVQNGLGVKNMSVLVRKEIHSIFETKNPAKDQVKNYKRHENNCIIILMLLWCMFVVISCQE